MTNNDSEQFVAEFKTLADKNFDGNHEEHDSLYKLGRRLLKSGNGLNKKPASIDYSTWDSMKFYLMDSYLYFC